MPDLFSIPTAAVRCDENTPVLPAGGFGTGGFRFTPEGEIRDWKLHPGLPAEDTPVPANRFHVWARQERDVQAVTLAERPSPWPVGAPRPDCWRLFPFTWRRYELPGPLMFEALCFSPLLPGSDREASLPVHTVLWRAGNRSRRRIEAALMLTWACAWPQPVEDATFDMQHDNLCITGALGSPESTDRIGIAVPDLHSEGIYQQGMEPWTPMEDSGELWEDFAEDGELDPALAATGSMGSAAWVKFTLDPDEVKEVPFVLVWHFPYYESGPDAGKPRRYTQHLEKFRPDNAVVWLAEEVVQNFGQETANYRYWLQQIQDWHSEVLGDPLQATATSTARVDRLSALLEADTSWPADGDLTIQPGPNQTPNSLSASLRQAFPLTDLWPDLARNIHGPDTV